MPYIVKGVKKPKMCKNYENGKLTYCYFLDDDEGCRLQKKSHEMSYEEQFESCPIVWIPQSHGRIVDLKTGRILLEPEQQYFPKRG